LTPGARDAQSPILCRHNGLNILRACTTRGTHPTFPTHAFRPRLWLSTGAPDHDRLFLGFTPIG
jgi:hypothetical protein